MLWWALCIFLCSPLAVQARLLPNDWSTGPHPPVYQDASELARDDFNRLTSNGTVFIVRGAARLPNYHGWSCSELKHHTTFKDAEGELLYANGPSMPLGGDWEEHLAETNATKLDQDAPQVGAFRLGFRDYGKPHLEVSSSWTPDMIELMKDLAEAPPFMDTNNVWRDNPSGAGELESLHTTSELWLAPPGAGVQARLNPHLANTMVLQLSGSTRWRLSPVPDRSFPSMLPEYRDGGEVYSAFDGGWKPHYNFVLEEGDALFFPPGTIHEELGVDSSCSLYLTHQYSIPMPARYLRQHLRRFRHCGDLFQSWALMEEWAMLGGFLEVLDGPARQTDLEGLLKHAYGSMWNDAELSAPLRDAFAFLDQNEDGIVTLQDVKDAALELQTAAFVRGPAASLDEEKEEDL
mmetsp:Transcript_12131/g.28325  ORF Transcript_12131/g.28325 Transcript_12131/m.28325 type:complete len:406 (+) Transcript_12131:82-1299(+)